MQNKKVYSYYFIIPAFMLYTVFFIIPTIASFGYSFTNWNAASIKIKFIGFENFIYIFSNQKTLLKYIYNTFLFAVVTTVFKNLFGIGLALLMDAKVRGQNFLRGVFFLPYVLSPIVLGIVFASIFAPQGLFNNLLRLIGMDSITCAWLFDPRFAFVAVIFVEIWKYTGFNMVIYLAGLQTISREYYQSAEIDGANWWTKFKTITVPLIIPSITINLVLNAITGLRVFDIVYVLTNGGPGDRTDVLNTIVFKEYSNGLYGLSTALGVVLFIITAITAFALLRFMSSKERDLQ